MEMIWIPWGLSFVPKVLSPQRYTSKLYVLLSSAWDLLVSIEQQSLTAINAMNHDTQLVYL
jgi:hypothetical protein